MAYKSLYFVNDYYTTAIEGHKIYAVAYGDVDKAYFNDSHQKNLIGGQIFSAKTFSATAKTELTVGVGVGKTANTTIRMFFYDLTQMFGSGNEPTTIEEFYSRIPQGIDLNAYNEGEVIDMNVQGIKSVGRNAWDEQWELGTINAEGANAASYLQIRSKNFCKCLPNANYYAKDDTNGKLLLYFYDKDKGFIERLSVPNKSFTTKPNAAFFRVRVDDTTAYTEGICINLSDTEFNGQYEPYIEASEDLSVVAKYFPNGMRSAGTAHDEIRYNKQTNKWEKVVRIAEVDLGSFSWVSESNNIFYAVAVGIGLLYGYNILTIPYAASGANSIPSVDKTIAITNSVITPIIRIKDSAYTDAASFKAAMSGVMLYYELAEPIVTEIEEKDFNLDYSVWNCGTEQAIAEGKSSALAADITYGFNAVGLIKQLRTLVEAMAAKLANL